MKHSTSPELRDLSESLDRLLKDQAVCGECLGLLLLAATAETLRCCDPDELERMSPEIQRVAASGGRSDRAN